MEELLISLLLPTRKRPVQLQRMVESVQSTAKNPVEIVCRVDLDDDSYDALHALWPDVHFIFGPRIRNITACWNECFKECSGDIVCQANDDIVFRTEGWDTMIEEEFHKFPDHIVMVHGDHLGGYEGRLFGPHPFVHRRWVEIVGRFIDPWYSSDYGDTGINHIANALGRRRFLPRVVIEHMHFTVGKAEVDEVTEDRLRHHAEDDPDKVYWSHLDDRLEAANKLAKAMFPVYRRVIDVDLNFSGYGAGRCPKCGQMSTVFVDTKKYCNVCGNEGFA